MSVRQLPSPAGSIQGATKLPWFIFPVNQPEQRGYVNTQMNRYVVDAPKYIHRGAAIMSTDPIPVTKQPELAYLLFSRWKDSNLNRYIVDAQKQLHQGARVMATFPVPPVSNPLFNHYFPSINRYIDELVKRFEGATKQQQYLFPPNQPELTGFERVKQKLRYIVGAAPRYDGATKQNWYIYPTSQPVMSYYLPNPNRSNPFPPFISVGNLIVKAMADAIMNAASRFATVSTLGSYFRNMSDTIANAASRLATVTKGLAKNMADAIMNAAGRFAAVSRIASFIRTEADAVMNAASRFTTLTKGLARTMSASLMNSASRFATLAGLKTVIRIMSDGIMNARGRYAVMKAYVNGLLIQFMSKFTPQGTTFSGKYTPQGTTFGDKYQKQNTVFDDKYQ